MNDQTRTGKRVTMRSLARLASEIVAPYWPMRTFVHHNPLHELEGMHFVEALDRAHELLGARRYLSNETYRERFLSGLIKEQSIDAAVSEMASSASLSIGSKTISKFDVQKTLLIEGLDAPAEPQMQLLWENDPDRNELLSLADHIRSGMQSQHDLNAHIQTTIQKLGEKATLVRWLDETLGTQFESQLNRNLAQWCAAFLDEGEAGWSMPDRQKGFYATWKNLVKFKHFGPCGPGWQSLVSSLPENPEDVLVDCVSSLQIPESLITDYFAAQFSSMPGWAAFIKWRSGQPTNPWQRHCPIDLVQYLAVRLVYEWGLVSHVCKKMLGIEGTYESMRAFMESNAQAYMLLRQRAAGELTDSQIRRIDRILHSTATPDWKQIQQVVPDLASSFEERAVRQTAWRLRKLAASSHLSINELIACDPQVLMELVGWLNEFTQDSQGLVWLKASEHQYQEWLFQELQLAMSKQQIGQSDEKSRPQAQAVFCIDVRSEPFRRNLESLGPYETLGFAGFFNCFIRYQSLESHHESDQFPVVMKARNLVREVPRPYEQTKLAHYRRGKQLLSSVREALHDLKGHIITPYVTVESLGWAYIVPFVLKTLSPRFYAAIRKRIVHTLQRPVATSLTIDKLRPPEAEQMVIDNQLSIISDALTERFRLHKKQVNHEQLVNLRNLALGEIQLSQVDKASLPELSEAQISAFIEELRRDYNITSRAASNQKERITRTGFTLAEQVFTVEVALRMMGLTSNFARLVLITAHGSTSDNNPFESALNCGACGGSEGNANSRVFAAIANKLEVRNELAKKGIEIPSDTYFLAGQIDTTTDVVELFDLEDVPPTHRLDLVRLTENLKDAGELTSQERCVRLPGAGYLKPAAASRETKARSCDWSQVRPEWGLSGNASFIIGRRELSKSIDLKGRAFLNSYDHRLDPEGSLLENLLTAPQAVCEWINMEHYFSTVDNDVFGAGSKIYHNVTSNVGVMFGTAGDLRVGLPEQTVMNGPMAYHEPLRLTTVVDARPEKIEKLIARHELLQRFYHNEWVHLLAVDTEKKAMYRYRPSGKWEEVLDPTLSSTNESVAGSIVQRR